MQRGLTNPRKEKKNYYKKSKTKFESLEYDTASADEVLFLEVLGMWNKPSLPLIPDEFISRSVRISLVSFMVKIDLFANSLYLIYNQMPKSLKKQLNKNFNINVE